MAATAMPGAALESAEAEAAAPEGGLEAAIRSAVTLVEGEATILRANENSESLDAGAAVGPGDVLKTGSEAVLGVNLADHFGLAMGANSILVRSFHCWNRQVIKMARVWRVRCVCL